MAVPNQRMLKIHKEPTDRNNLFTANNLMALDEASRLLQTKGGFKLYMYLAKNQNNYKLELSSADFTYWSGLGITAYRSAFNELVEKGYLVEQSKNNYIFYDKSQLSEYGEKVIIEVPEEKVEEIRNIEKKIMDQFTF